MNRLLLIACIPLLVPAGAVAQERAAPADVRTRLERIAPERAGFSPERLAELADYLDEAGSSALVLLHDGRIAFEWGDVHRRHVIHSIRKSLLNSLYGIHVERGAIDTTATLAQLGIDDAPPLSAGEKSARVADLLRSRSGIYHDAAAVSEGMLRARPERGTHAPGEAFYYNNWDFNALATIFERQTGRNVYHAFREDVARPLGMMHYEGSWTRIDGSDPDARIPDTDGVFQYEIDKSRHPAYHFRLSAHDLALYGQLYLNQGRWHERQIVPRDWIEASTTAYSVTNPHVGIGYGMLWYVLMPGEERETKSFFHTGAGVHMLGVYPASKLVFVHRVDTENGSDFTQDRLYRIISLVFAAREQGE